jgi:hypothetical protein
MVCAKSVSTASIEPHTAADSCVLLMQEGRTGAGSDRAENSSHHTGTSYADAGVASGAALLYSHLCTTARMVQEADASTVRDNCLRAQWLCGAGSACHVVPYCWMRRSTAARIVRAWCFCQHLRCVLPLLQEKASLIAALAAGPSSTSNSSSAGSSSGGSVKQALQENLVEQLQRHLDDLVTARAARQAVLGAS